MQPLRFAAKSSAVKAIADSLFTVFFMIKYPPDFA